MSLIERKITVTFLLADGAFANGGSSLEVSGLRCEAQIDNINGVSLGALQLRIHGMRIEDMNSLSLLGKKYMEARRNQVIVSAGDDDAGMTQVFSGTIFQAFIDYGSMPDVGFVVSASSAYFESLQKTAAVSVDGSVDVATIIQSISSGIGFDFKNNGVTAKLSNQYLDGSPIAQITCAAQAARIACSITNQKVSIWPNGGVRDDQVVPISKETGLVGYPRYSQYGIDVVTLFNPLLANGRKATVTSDAVGASGDWYVQVVRHELASQVPGGPWYSTAQLTGEGFYVAH